MHITSKVVIDHVLLSPQNLADSRRSTYPPVSFTRRHMRSSSGVMNVEGGLSKFQFRDIIIFREHGTAPKSTDLNATTCNLVVVCSPYDDGA